MVLEAFGQRFGGQRRYSLVFKNTFIMFTNRNFNRNSYFLIFLLHLLIFSFNFLHFLSILMKSCFFLLQIPWNISVFRITENLWLYFYVTIALMTWLWAQLRKRLFRIAGVPRTTRHWVCVFQSILFSKFMLLLCYLKNHPLNLISLPLW